MRRWLQRLQRGAPLRRRASVAPNISSAWRLPRKPPATSTITGRFRLRGAPTLGIALALLCLMSYAAVWSLQPTPITGSEAFNLLACHDDTHIQRTWTHGNPNDGTFRGSTTPNHSNSYYYLDAQAAAGCGRGSAGRYHFVGRVTLAGPLANGSPGGIGNPKRTNLSNEHPAWGFEYKTPSGTILHPCIGGDGSGGNNCPENPNPLAVNGGAVAEWRYDGDVSGVRFRVDNQYDETLW